MSRAISTKALDEWGLELKDNYTFCYNDKHENSYKYTYRYNYRVF